MQLASTCINKNLLSLWLLQTERHHHVTSSSLQTWRSCLKHLKPGNGIQFHAVTYFVKNPWTHDERWLHSNSYMHVSPHIPSLMESQAKHERSSTAFVIDGAMTDDLNSDLYHGEVSFESKPRMVSNNPSFQYNLSNPNPLTICFEWVLKQPQASKVAICWKHDPSNPRQCQWSTNPSCWVNWLWASGWSLSGQFPLKDLTCPQWCRCQDACASNGGWWRPDPSIRSPGSYRIIPDLWKSWIHLAIQNTPKVAQIGTADMSRKKWDHDTMIQNEK